MKCHLKNRDGWVKTIDQPGPVNTIMVPERTDLSQQQDFGVVREFIVARRFELVMEAQMRNHRTNESFIEAGYEEA